MRVCVCVCVCVFVCLCEFLCVSASVFACEGEKEGDEGSML